MRTIDPLSAVSLREFVAARLRENSPNSIKEAYNAAPADPLVLAALAALTFEDDVDEALFYMKVALRSARMSGDPEQIAQIQAAAKTLSPAAPNFAP